MNDPSKPQVPPADRLPHFVTREPWDPYVDDKLTVVVFANQSRANPSKIAHAVAALFNADLSPVAPSQK